ncbi:MAG TPA: molybdopterin cofactor-binding domain-containing protein, partial [Spongiibacteraceae bacterium]|nr:molybdopterin cofactor-binding domain-containing protein [Spongiibacteraceae bacterium]
SASRQISGVSDIFTLGKDAIVIVADGYWVAHKASRTLQIDWDRGALADLNSESIRAALQQQLASNNGHNVSLEGAAMAGTTQALEAEYFAPYQAHAPMEPPNCVAAVATDRVDIWCGNQSPDALQHVIASALQRPRETVFIHSQLIGGSFGRRLYYDYAVEAALISQRIGKPIKLIWSREDDIRHDLYRPAALSRFRAQLREGKLIGWENKIAGPSGKQDVLPAIAERIVAHLPDSVARSINEHFAEHKFSSAEGATQLLYAIPYLKVDFAECNPGVPFGAWRSVGNSVNGFFVESFIDEIAQTLQQDPLAFRLSQLKPEATRARAVLELVGDKSHWGKVAAGHYQGIAVFEAFDTVVAEVAEISIEDAQIKVHKVTCAIDCGRVVNPDIVKAQIESGVIFALSAALTCEITIENGAVAQSNFHDFEPIRMHNAPAVEVHIIPSEASPTGVGEPGVPPLAAAVGNAIFAATGKRLRELPFRL